MGAWRPKDFHNFLEHHQDRLNRFASGSSTVSSTNAKLKYSELIYDASSWVAGLPLTIGAVFFMDSSLELETRQVHAQLLHDYDLDEDAVPLLKLNMANTRMPFTTVQNVPSQLNMSWR